MTKEIFVLTKRMVKFFGDEEYETTIVGWTTDFKVAREWKWSSHRDERRDIELVKEVTVDKTHGVVVLSHK